MKRTNIEYQKFTKEKYSRPHKRELQKYFTVILDTLTDDDKLKSYLPKTVPHEFTVAVVENHESQKLNANSRGINKETNVLSFPFESPNEEMAYYLGDIALCGSVIFKEAAEKRIDVKKYWAHMFIHGCLHLLGFDHNTDETAEIMEDLEIKILDKLELNPY